YIATIDALSEMSIVSSVPLRLAPITSWSRDKSPAIFLRKSRVAQIANMRIAASYTRMYSDVDYVDFGAPPRNTQCWRESTTRGRPAKPRGGQRKQGEDNDGGIPFNHLVAHRGAGAGGVGRDPRFDSLAAMVEE